VASKGSAGRIDQWPASGSSSALKALGESKRGDGHHVTVPSDATSAAERQSLSSA
jgi:hypothetical protein